MQLTFKALFKVDLTRTREGGEPIRRLELVGTILDTDDLAEMSSGELSFGMQLLVSSLFMKGSIDLVDVHGVELESLRCLPFEKPERLSVAA